ncbi:MAG TPA: glycosyltransferase, partial [Dissulfurispiraceae bacterium]
MISVIIVNYHSASLTERAVRSVFSDSEDVEVIIADNTAAEEERRRLRELSAAYPLTLIFNQDNAGFARANNQAFSVAKGEYLLLLNPDACIVPPCLGALKAFMESTPSAGAVSPMVYWDDRMTFFFPHYPFPSPFDDLCTKMSGLSGIFRTLYTLHERRKNLDLWRS